MTKPLTDMDLDYIKQAKTVIASLLEIVENVEDQDNETFMFYLDAARGYVRDAVKWLENSDNLNSYEMDLVHAAVATAHYTTNLFIQHCGYLLPMVVCENTVEVINE